MLGKFNGPNPIILVIEHLVIDSCRELQRCHLFNLCMRIVFVIENDLLVRSVTSEIIHREREHPHLFGLIFPEESFQVVRVSRTFVPGRSPRKRRSPLPILSVLSFRKATAFCFQSFCPTHSSRYRSQTVTSQSILFRKDDGRGNAPGCRNYRACSSRPA